MVWLLSVFTGFKKYFYIAISVATSIFLAWVYFLKKDNEAKKEEIEELQEEAIVKAKVTEEAEKVAEFKGTIEANEASLDELKAEYNKVKENSDEDIFPDVSPPGYSRD